MRLPICLAGCLFLGFIALAGAQAPPPSVSWATAPQAAKPVPAPAAPAVAKAAPAAVVEPYIEQLASRDFKARGAAVKAIMKIGTPALPALQKAKDHRDAEVRRRAEELITVLERAAALAPKVVTLKLDKKPVRDVLNEVAKQSGITIPTNDAWFNGPQGKAPCSFQFDKTPFWEALDKICEKCGLIVQGNAGDNTLRVNFADSYEPYRSYDGSFKVLATGFSYNKYTNFGELPKTPYQPGQQGQEQLSLSLTVYVEPRVPILKVGQTRLSVALDDAGTSMIANNANYYWYERYYNGGNNRSFMQNASANLAWPSKNSRTVKILKGIIPVTLLAEQRPVVVSDAILSTKGKKLKAANSTFNIDDITNSNKQHQIKITYGDDGGDNPYDPYGRFQSIQQRLELQDAKGNKIPANVQIYSYNQNSVQLQIMTQSAGTNSKIGPPAKLVFQVWVQLEHEVAFEFKDLPLP